MRKNFAVSWQFRDILLHKPLIWLSNFLNDFLVLYEEQKSIFISSGHQFPVKFVEYYREDSVGRGKPAIQWHERFRAKGTPLMLPPGKSSVPKENSRWEKWKTRKSFHQLALSSMTISVMQCNILLQATSKFANHFSQQWRQWQSLKFRVQPTHWSSDTKNSMLAVIPKNCTKKLLM